MYIILYLDCSHLFYFYHSVCNPLGHRSVKKSTHADRNANVCQLPLEWKAFYLILFCFVSIYFLFGMSTNFVILSIFFLHSFFFSFIISELRRTFTQSNKSRAIIALLNDVFSNDGFKTDANDKLLTFILHAHMHTRTHRDTSIHSTWALFI